MQLTSQFEEWKTVEIRYQERVVERVAELVREKVTNMIKVLDSDLLPANDADIAMKKKSQSTHDDRTGREINLYRIRRPERK